MFYNFRFRMALQALCHPSSQAMSGAAQDLPLLPRHLAHTLGKPNPNIFKKRGYSPTQSAIMRVCSLIEKSKHEDVSGPVIVYLALALASHAARDVVDADLIAHLMEPSANENDDPELFNHTFLQSV